MAEPGTSEVEWPRQKLRIAPIDETRLCRSADDVVNAEEVGPVKQVRRFDDEVHTRGRPRSDSNKIACSF